jgi:hypothetical protein
MNFTKYLKALVPVFLKLSQNNWKREDFQIQFIRLVLSWPNARQEHYEKRKLLANIPDKNKF